MATELPPFPVDDATLDLLEAAMNPREHGDPDAVSSSVWPLLEFRLRALTRTETT